MPETQDHEVWQTVTKSGMKVVAKSPEPSQSKRNKKNHTTVKSKNSSRPPRKCPRGRRCLQNTHCKLVHSKQEKKFFQKKREEWKENICPAKNDCDDTGCGLLHPTDWARFWKSKKSGGLLGSPNSSSSSFCSPAISSASSDRSVSMTVSEISIPTSLPSLTSELTDLSRGLSTGSSIGFVATGYAVPFAATFAPTFARCGDGHLCCKGVACDLWHSDADHAFFKLLADHNELGQQNIGLLVELGKTKGENDRLAEENKRIREEANSLRDENTTLRSKMDVVAHNLACAYDAVATVMGKPKPLS